jgi:hypothetical protein
MTDLRSITLRAGIALALALTVPACTNKSAAPDTSQTDTDSRNNENNTLGAKSLPQQGDLLPQADSLDKMEFHYNSRLAMNEVLSEQLPRQIPEVAQAHVALTESNIYAAVKLKGMEAKSLAGTSADAQQQMPNGKTGAGIFATGQGAALDWQSQNGLTTDLQGRITAALHRMVPGKANIFVSSNPNYFRRFSYYAEESRAGTSMDRFLSEFNTMAHYAFPPNANGSNYGNR